MQATGPCTPTVSSCSMSPVRLGPLTQTRFDGRRSGWPVKRRQTSPGVATRRSTGATHRCDPREQADDPAPRRPRVDHQRTGGGDQRHGGRHPQVGRGEGLGRGLRQGHPETRAAARRRRWRRRRPSRRRCGCRAARRGRRAARCRARGPGARCTVEPWSVAMRAKVPGRSSGSTTRNTGDGTVPGAAGGGCTRFWSGVDRRRVRAVARKRARSPCSRPGASAIVAPLRPRAGDRQRATRGVGAQPGEPGGGADQRAGERRQADAAPVARRADPTPGPRPATPGGWCVTTTGRCGAAGPTTGPATGSRPGRPACRRRTASRRRRSRRPRGARARAAGSAPPPWAPRRRRRTRGRPPGGTPGRR